MLKCTTVRIATGGESRRVPRVPCWGLLLEVPLLRSLAKGASGMMLKSLAEGASSAMPRSFRGCCKHDVEVF
ncbi:conserved hypothetical protein [Ricinus communis]|uniref:Uncharacterized protein n=1 Tax=Ricinus communis TaxID=3988 RepID=B9RSN5_RICCO|nr:conserved hypothetical protein [Ricinus communis]